MKSGEGMNNIKLILIVLIILSSFFPGCVKAPEGTPTLTATPTAAVTAIPTIVQTTPSPTPTPAQVRAPLNYTMDVDDDYGFYRVRIINSNQTPSFYNFNLTISSGDKVIWISDSDYTITIASEQGLWDNTSAKLRWSYQEFNYTFTRPGTYGVYIIEYPRKRLNIIVNP